MVLIACCLRLIEYFPDKIDPSIWSDASDYADHLLVVSIHGAMG